MYLLLELLYHKRNPRITTVVLFCAKLKVGGGGGEQICKFWEKHPQVHIIIIRVWPKNNTPILRNIDNSPPGAFFAKYLNISNI